MGSPILSMLSPALTSHAGFFTLRPMAKPALRRGLGALLGGATPTAKPALPPAPTDTQPSLASTPAGAPGEQVMRVPLDRVRACPFQPRKEFPAETLQELADSM